MNRGQNGTEKMKDESEETLELFSERLDAATPCGEKEQQGGTQNAAPVAGFAAGTGAEKHAREKQRATDKIGEAVTAAADRARSKQRG